MLKFDSRLLRYVYSFSALVSLELMVLIDVNILLNDSFFYGFDFDFHLSVLGLEHWLLCTSPDYGDVLIVLFSDRDLLDGVLNLLPILGCTVKSEALGELGWVSVVVLIGLTLTTDSENPAIVFHFTIPILMTIQNLHIDRP